MFPIRDNENGPRTFEEAVNKARELGVIPADVPDAEITVVVVDADGVETLTETEQPPVELEWEAGRPLPHTSFDDPPFHVTAEEWRDQLVNAARRADDLETFRFAVMCSLGRDMVFSHGVPAETALDGCAEFATRLYGEYHDAQSG